MTVEQILRFIKKYNLNGNGADRLVIGSNGGSSLVAEFHDSQKVLLGRVEMEGEFPLETITVNSTKTLISLLGALDPTAELEWEEAEKNANGVITQLRISDGRTNAYVACADPLSIPEVRHMRQLPEWDVIFKPSQDFIKRLIKYQSATSAVAIKFEVGNGKVTTVTNPQVINSNQLVETVDSSMVEVCSADTFNLTFFAPLLVSIFASNSDSEIVVKISKVGVLNITASTAGFETDYKIKPRIA